MILRRDFSLYLSRLCYFAMTLIVASVLAFPLTAFASALTALSDTMSRQGNGVASNHTIKFTSSTGAGDSTDTITVTMPTGFTIGTVDYTDIDLSHGASTGAETEETLAATASSSAWGASFTGQVLTLTHPSDGANGDIATSDKVIIEIGTNASGGNAQITNHSTAATYTIAIAGDFGDTGSIAIVVVDDDQVVVSATVSPSLTFTIDHNDSAFGNISTGSIATAGTDITLSIGTNSATGYAITVNDAGDGVNPGLYNATANHVIGSASSVYGDTATLSADTEGYGIQGSSASSTIATRYAQTGNAVGGLETTPTPFASHSSTMNSNHTITITHKASVSAWTPAGAYSDTVTYIATGNY